MPISASEFAKRINRPKNTVCRWVRLGYLPAKITPAKGKTGYSYEIDEKYIDIYANPETNPVLNMEKTKREGHRWSKKNLYYKKSLSLTHYMEELCIWCDAHPDSEIKNYDYGKAVLLHLIDEDNK